MNDIEARFWRYHKENPQVFTMIWLYAHQIKDAGVEHYGIGAIFERLRWHFQIEKKDAEFKLNDNYRSRYSRLLESLYPEFRGFFTKRALKTDSILGS